MFLSDNFRPRQRTGNAPVRTCHPLGACGNEVTDGDLRAQLPGGKLFPGYRNAGGR